MCGRHSIDGENIPNEKIAAAVAVGASVIEHWSTVSGIAVVWLMALLVPVIVFQ